MGIKKLFIVIEGTKAKGFSILLSRHMSVLWCEL